MVSQVLTNVPEGTQFYKFDAITQRWKVNQFQFGRWAWPQQTLAPGEGAFIRNPTNSFSITFTGAPPTNFVFSVRSGYNLLSLPTDGTSQLKYHDNDLLREWDSTLTNYRPFLISLQDNWYDPLTGQREEPSLRAGESFIYYRTPALGETLPQLLPSIYFNNYAPASGLDAPISSSYGCFGSTWVAQLYGVYYALFEPSIYVLLGVPVPLLASAGSTYVNPQLDAVQIPISIDAPTSFVIRVWDNRRSSTYEALPPSSGSRGSSRIFHLTPGSALAPPVNLVGLRPFTIGPITPFWSTYPSPTNAVVFEGQPAQFSVSYASSLPDGDLFAYQWQKETAPDTWTDIAGATTITLVIPSTQNTDAGRYRAAFRFDCASDVSLPAVLTVIGEQRPRLEATMASAGNQTLILSGMRSPTSSYQLEASFDLSHWSDLTAVQSGSGRWEILVTNVPEFSRRFFRVRLAP